MMLTLTNILAIIGALFARLLACGSVYSWGVFLSLFKDDFQISSFHVSLIFALVQGLTQGAGLVVPSFLRRFSVRTVVSCGAILSATSVFAASFTKSYLAFTIVFGVFQGIGQSLVFVTIPIAATYILPSQYSHIAVSLAISGDGFGMVLFPLLFNFLLDYFSWRQTLLITSAILLHGLVCGMLLNIKHRDTSDSISGSETSQKQSFLSELGNLNFAIIFLASLLDSMSFSSCISYIFVHIETSPNGSQYLGTLLMSLIGAASIIGRLLVSFVGNSRIPRWFLFSLTHFFQGLGIFGMAYGPITYYWLCTCGAVFGLNAGLGATLLCLVCCDMCGKELLTKTFSYSMFAWGVGSTIGPSVSGLLHDLTGSTQTPVSLGGFGFVLSGFLLIYFCRGRVNSPRVLA